MPSPSRDFVRAAARRLFCAPCAALSPTPHAAFDKEKRKRELRRLKEQAEAAEAREWRKAAMEKAQAVLENARSEHERRAAIIEKDREAVERRAQAEDERWQKLQSRLAEALRKASG